MGILDFAGLTGGDAATLLVDTRDMTGSNTSPGDWQLIAPATLGFSSAFVNSAGNLEIGQPGGEEGGIEFRVFGRYENGVLTEVSLAFLATNAAIDILDYFQLNEGTPIANEMAPMLAELAAFATGNGLSGANTIVTGFSLGGAYANILARFSDTLASGFFASATYIGHESPLIFEAANVFNFGYENDVVFRATGNATSFLEALIPTLPDLSGQDYDLLTSTDNLVLFDDAYAANLHEFGFTLLNFPGGWSAHFGARGTDAIERIAASEFYDLTNRDSVVVVSEMSDLVRSFIWLEDKPALSHSHDGASAFLIGSAFDDLIRDGVANDFVDAGAGGDTVALSTGHDIVSGGAGADAVRVTGAPEDWTAYRLTDGTVFLFGADGLKELSAVETVLIDDAGFVHRYDVTAAALVETTFGLSFLDEDIPYAAATEGGAGDETLAGAAVFGLGGDDLLIGVGAQSLVVGGDGSDTLVGSEGDDAFYGGAGTDFFVYSGGNDTMNGGAGEDVFIIDGTLAGSVTFTDLGTFVGEMDFVAITEGLFAGFADFLSGAVQTGADLSIARADLELIFENTLTGDLSADHFVFA